MDLFGWMSSISVFSTGVVDVDVVVDGEKERNEVK